VIIIFLDLVFFSPWREIPHSSSLNEMLRSPTQFFGGDFLYYLSVALQTTLGVDPRTQEAVAQNQGMRWLYPPPVLNLISFFVKEGGVVPLYLAACFTGLGLCVLAFCLIFRRIRNTGQTGSFAVVSLWPIAWSLVAVTFPPTFLVASLTTLNIGAILLVVMTICVISDRAKAVFYSCCWILSYIKPQYLTLFLTYSLSGKRLDGKGLIYICSVACAHGLSFLFFEYDYLQWVLEIKKYAFERTSNGFWWLSMVQSKNMIKILFGFTVPLASITIILLLLRDFFMLSGSRERLESKIILYSALFLICPRIYEYEFFAIAIVLFFYFLKNANDLQRSLFLCFTL